MMKLATTLAVSCLLASCSQGNNTEAENTRAPATLTTEIAISDLPQSVTDAVIAKRADFQIIEVLKKVRDGRTYYDVEGQLPDDTELEFDVLMTAGGPQIVEIQRDILWTQVPEKAQAIVNAANTDTLKIVRIIESVQLDNSIIYEVFVADKPSGPYFEVQRSTTQGAETFKLLSQRWKH